MKKNKMNRYILMIITVILLTAAFPSKKATALSTIDVKVNAASAIVMEQKSGRILYSKDIHTKRRIASITKIMTAILAIESGKLDDIVEVTNSALQTEGSSIFLQPGQKIKLEDLVYGLMLRSGNDAANMIAEYVGGSLEGFVYMMNEKAAEIGMKNTTFMNPSGLDTSDKHLSTAYDMALLTKYAMYNKTYQEITATKFHRVPSADGKWEWTWKNKNKLLTTLYEYSTGGKTGYTRLAKRTLVSTAKKHHMDLITVTLNDSSDWDDHMALFEKSYKTYELKKLLRKGKVYGVKYKHLKNSLYVENDFYYPLTKKEAKQVRFKIQLIKQEADWNKKMRSGEEAVGKIKIFVGDEEVGARSIYYHNSVSMVKKYTKYVLTVMTGVH